ncbi:longifolia 1-like protein [Tanacetum coccineum]
MPGLPSNVTTTPDATSRCLSPDATSRYFAATTVYFCRHLCQHHVLSATTAAIVFAVCQANDHGFGGIQDNGEYLQTILRSVRADSASIVLRGIACTTIKKKKVVEGFKRTSHVIYKEIEGCLPVRTHEGIGVEMETERVCWYMTGHDLRNEKSGVTHLIYILRELSWVSVTMGSRGTGVLEVKELPRLSIDSKQNSNRNSMNESRRSIPMEQVQGGAKNKTSHEPGSNKRPSPGVVARLMGLESLTDSSSEVKTSKIMSPLNDHPSSRLSRNGEEYKQNHGSVSPRVYLKIKLASQQQEDNDELTKKLLFMVRWRKDRVHLSLKHQGSISEYLSRYLKQWKPQEEC